MSRRLVLQSSLVGTLGVAAAASTPLSAASSTRPKSCIYIFLSGGLAQHDTFDPKPQAPDSIRGEFSPISTSTPGIQICEHLPQLAQRSHQWAICRSMTHNCNDHSLGHHIMLTGRSPAPVGFDGTKPMGSDFPSIASIVNRLLPSGTTLPATAVLPETLIHRTGRIIPGQFAGEMGSRWDPWFIEASNFNSLSYGAYPEFGFHFVRGSEAPPRHWSYQAPSLAFPDGLSNDRLNRRLELLRGVEEEQRTMRQQTASSRFERDRTAAVSLLTDPQIRQVVDVTHANDDQQRRYGKNYFGWSLLMAKNLIDAGVRFVQVNLGNNETWDTHERAFGVLKDNLLPPTDQAVSALLDDLSDSGRLDDTLIVMAGEFGRTPKVFAFPGAESKLPGRDHWGMVQTVWFAGGGVTGGRVIGSSDKTGGYPANDPQTPENLAATIYDSLGIPADAVWRDDLLRPHNVYQGQPIAGLRG
jgi:hypothetical protein